MKKQLSLLLILATLVIAMGMAPQVQAAQLTFKSPMNPGATNYRYKGEMANAYYSSTTDGCIYTDLLVFAGETTAKSGPGAPVTGRSIYLELHHYDRCTWTWLSSAYGSAPIDNNTFQIDPKLNSAHLQQTVSMFDAMTGATFNLATDLTWTGTGDVSRNKSRSQYESNGCKINSSFTGAWRAATVSGTVSDGTTNYGAAPLLYAELQSTKNGALAIGCGW